MTLYRQHAVCEGRGCHLCDSRGLVNSGLTTEAFDQLRKEVHDLRNQLQSMIAQQLIHRMEGKD